MRERHRQGKKETRKGEKLEKRENRDGAGVVGKVKDKKK